MGKENLPIVDEPSVEVDAEDPNFFPTENGGVFADLVRVQRITNTRKLPSGVEIEIKKVHMVGGSFIDNNRMWHFRVTPTTNSRGDRDWYPYRAIASSDLGIPVSGGASYTAEDLQRVKEKFPDLQFSDAAQDVYPNILPIMPEISAAIDKAIADQNGSTE